MIGDKVTLECCVSWKDPMYSTHSSKRQKNSKKAHERLEPSTDAVWHKFRSTRKGESRDIFIISDEGTYNDLIVEEKKAGNERVVREDGGEPLQLVDEDVTDPILGGDQGSSDSFSVHSIGTRSGPSYSPPGLCFDCQTLYRKAKRMKKPLDKILDNDPKSLTCDQWILKKKWRPRRLCPAKGLWTSLRLIKKRCNEKYRNQCDGTGTQSACSRPHSFLQRNLRLCVKMLKKRKEQRIRRRKRSRNVTQEPHLTKRRQCHSDSHHSIAILPNGNPHPSFSSESVLWSCSEDEESCTHLTFEVIPSSVTMETQPPEAQTRQQLSTQSRAFRDLLTKQCGNNSTIVKESCL
ncbi:uncharacterized protein si:ch211-227n13.3 isoform X2 [Lampris incognitus]|uniref:uncharacterized protein si:ch211-227n13.3 isoform X2 n=1 Tax=Lampris incognitus TaxID=2546036 RepID=UPI0024B4CBCA|nr:uncharacterized protein si:ch211-227n13.3 isoform X2 [Lampris incognitus]